METIANHDRYYDPPDEPTHAECDECGEVFDIGDLNKTGKYWPFRWLCDDCLEAQEAAEDD